jgi:hypothetical protein
LYKPSPDGLWHWVAISPEHQLQRSSLQVAFATSLVAKRTATNVACLVSDVLRVKATYSIASFWWLRLPSGNQRWQLKVHYKWCFNGKIIVNDGFSSKPRLITGGQREKAIALGGAILVATPQKKMIGLSLLMNFPHLSGDFPPRHTSFDGMSLHLRWKVHP